MTGESETDMILTDDMIANAQKVPIEWVPALDEETRDFVYANTWSVPPKAGDDDDDDGADTPIFVPIPSGDSK